MKKIELHKQDYVLVDENGNPIESCDIIYNITSVNELFSHAIMDTEEIEETIQLLKENGEVPFDNESRLISMTRLSSEVKQRYINCLMQS